MIKIVLHNMQAIGHAEIEVKDNSIVEFTGPNSNGKSVLGKVIQYTVSGDIKHKDTRLSLIKRMTDCGYTAIFWNNKALTIFLHLEVSKSFISYSEMVDGVENKIVRYLNEGGWKELLYEFGFRFYADGDICLQLYPTYGAIPFITTGGKVNDEIVNDITSDKVADDFINLFQTVTYPLFKKKVEQINLALQNTQMLYDNLVDYDYEAYEDIQKRMLDVQTAIKGYAPFRFSWIRLPHNTELAPYRPFRFKNIPIHELGVPAPRFSYEQSGISELVSVLNGVCPTCGQSLISEEV